MQIQASGNAMQVGVPTGIRTRVSALKERCPKPLDDGDTMASDSATRDVAYVGGGRKV